MSYFDLALDDGSIVQVRKLRAVRRSAKRSDLTRSYAGRKALYSTHIPTVRRRRERKCILSWVDGMTHDPVASRLPRTTVPHDPNMEKYTPLFLNMGWNVK